MVTRYRSTPSKILFAAASLLFIPHFFAAYAQSLSGLQIGDDETKLKSLGKEANADSYKSFTIRKWTLADGNDLSVTTSASGRIVYIETDWNGGDNHTTCDLPGLTFGVTSLADLRRRFGSNGLGFRARGYGIDIPDGVALFNSYEVGTVVVTFITKATRADYQRLKESGKNAAIAAYARLDGISIADAEYAKGEWGERIFDPNYKKIDWK